MKKIVIISFTILYLSSFNLNAEVYVNNDIFKFEKLYLGLGYQFGSYKAESNVKETSKPLAFKGKISGKDNGRILIGYDINEYFAVEISEILSNKVKQSDTVDSSIRETQFSAIIKGGDIDNIIPFLKFGFGSIEYKEKNKKSVTTENGTSFHMGIGTILELTKNHNVVLEAIYGIGDNKIANSIVNLKTAIFGISYKYSFAK